MTETTVCKAEDKLFDDIEKRDFPENLENYKKDEFLRKQLVDETEVEIINLRNVLYSVQNNFEAYSKTDYIHIHNSLDLISSMFKDMFDDIRSETAL